MSESNVTTKPRILLGHGYWGRGGAEVAAMWLLQALCEEFAVDLVTRGGFALEELNRCAGTQLTTAQFRLLRLPLPHLLAQTRGGTLWYAVFLRYCRYIAPRYDLCVTASCVIDWGAPALHFLTDTSWHAALRAQYPQAGWLMREHWNHVTFLLGQALGGRSRRSPLQHDHFVANSQWTAQRSAALCTRRPAVIYPAVPGAEHQAPWRQRETAFLSLGRIAPVKQLETVIAILDGVRALGHAMRLHLVGEFDNTAYARRILALCRERSDWIVRHGARYGPDKTALLAGIRYGISACEREAFGIATAEMIRAGMVPFVPREGAQQELVQREPLIYRDIPDAVRKIDALLRSPAKQWTLQQAMLQLAEAFATEHFCAAVRGVVRHVLVSAPMCSEQVDLSVMSVMSDQILLS